MKKQIIAAPQQPLPIVLVAFKLHFNEAFRAISEKFPGFSRPSRRVGARMAAREEMRASRGLVRVELPAGKFRIEQQKTAS